jgi:hypothetical protein
MDTGGSFPTVARWCSIIMPGLRTSLYLLSPQGLPWHVVGPLCFTRSQNECNILVFIILWSAGILFMVCAFCMDFIFAVATGWDIPVWNCNANWLIACPSLDTCQYGAAIQWYWQRKTEGLAEKSIPVRQKSDQAANLGPFYGLCYENHAKRVLLCLHVFYRQYYRPIRPLVWARRQYWEEAKQRAEISVAEVVTA